MIQIQKQLSTFPSVLSFTVPVKLTFEHARQNYCSLDMKLAVCDTYTYSGPTQQMLPVDQVSPLLRDDGRAAHSHLHQASSASQAGTHRLKGMLHLGIWLFSPSSIHASSPIVLSFLFQFRSQHSSVLVVSFQ